MTPFKAITDIIVYGSTYFKAGDRINALCYSAMDAKTDSIMAQYENYNLIIPKKFLIKLVD